MKGPPVIVVRLVHIHGPMKGEIQEFFEPSIIIGRHPSSHICFQDDLKISRKHAEIVREGNRFKVIDRSTNGTFVNGKRITEAYIKNGDVIMFSEGGPKVSFLSEMKSETEALSQPPPSQERPRPFPDQEAQKSSSKETPEKEAPLSQERLETPGKPHIQKVKAPLVIQYGPTLRSFNELPINIGKSPSCDFILNHPALMDRHAVIFYNQDQYWVKDLTGQRLIRVNQRPIDMESPLIKDADLALSPQGPFFRYLGEGRLAEAEQPPMKEPLNENREEKRESQSEMTRVKDLKGKAITFIDKILQKYMK